MIIKCREQGWKEKDRILNWHNAQPIGRMQEEKVRAKQESIERRTIAQRSELDRQRIDDHYCCCEYRNEENNVEAIEEIDAERIDDSDGQRQREGIVVEINVVEIADRGEEEGEYRRGRDRKVKDDKYRMRRWK